MKGLTRDRAISVALVAPSIILIAVFVYGFIGFTGFSSLTKWDITARLTSPSSGLHNYAAALHHRSHGSLPLRPAQHGDLHGPVPRACIVIGFFLAVLLDRHVKGEGIFRNIFLFPMAISYIVTGVVWRWILSPGNAQTGATGLNQLFDKIGLGFLKWGWFTDPTILYIHPESGFGTFLGHIGLGGLASPYIGVSLAMISVVIAATWQMSGYTMAMYLAALRGIPAEMREAARVDGATEFQIYRRVIVPMIRPVTLSALIVLGHISLKIFDLVVSMTGPGPAFATDVPGILHVGHDVPGKQLRPGSGNRHASPARRGAPHHPLPRLIDTVGGALMSTRSIPPPVPRGHGGRLRPSRHRLRCLPRADLPAARHRLQELPGSEPVHDVEAPHTASASRASSRRGAVGSQGIERACRELHEQRLSSRCPPP